MRQTIYKNISENYFLNWQLIYGEKIGLCLLENLYIVLAIYYFSIDESFEIA